MECRDSISGVGGLLSIWGMNAVFITNLVKLILP